MAIYGRNFLLAGALIVLPVTVNAATIVFASDLYAGMFVSKALVLDPNEEIQFLFNVMEDLNIEQFALSATGNNAGGDIAEIRYGFSSPGTNGFTTITSSGSSAFGGGFLPGLSLLAGSVFSIFFSDGITHPVSVTASFQTLAPTPVPLPASLSLLGGVLLVGGIFATRRRKTSMGDLAI